MSKTYQTRQWLNKSLSSSAHILAEVDVHGASLAISDCSRTVNIHMDDSPTSYSSNRTNRAAINRYKKKLNIIIDTCLAIMIEMDRRWP